MIAYIRQLYPFCLTGKKILFRNNESQKLIAQLEVALSHSPLPQESGRNHPTHRSALGTDGAPGLHLLGVALQMLN